MTLNIVPNYSNSNFKQFSIFLKCIVHEIPVPWFTPGRPGDLNAVDE